MTSSANKIDFTETDKTELQRIFDLQVSNQYKIGNTNYKERKTKLDKIMKTIIKYRSQIKEAMIKDYGKPPVETDLSEIYPVTSEIKHTKSHLKSWMMNQDVATPIALMGSSSHVQYEPKGVTLIISPWNYPFNLTFGPLISAVAAGNTVVIKPSEMTPHSSSLMKTMINELFDENEVALVEGGVETSTELLKLPFHHIFFTGSPGVGKIIMQAAAKNLTSVTLELGGKSPTIVDETANIKMAARRTAWGKFANNGQTCIAPDYIYVHESKMESFLSEMKKNLTSFYGASAQEGDSYARMVNAKHFNRVKGYLDDAVSKGAQIPIGGQTDATDNYIAPTIVINAPHDSTIMTEEIFGPLLPVISYSDINEVIDNINQKPKPLALYIYSKKNKNINHIVNNTRAGGTCINHNEAHFFNPNLPFGGTNNSGIGKSHGFDGFKEFSNARTIFKQHIPNALDTLTPPYNSKWKQKLIDITVKWL